jgi:hypothetical protein
VVSRDLHEEDVMSTTLVRVFDHLEHAVEARRQLLEAGIDSGRLDLTSLDDEAGPVEGNFISGNSDTSLRNGSGRTNLLPRGSAVGSDDQTYSRDFRHVERRGSMMLTIDAEDERQAELAGQVMERVGGTALN